MKKFLREQKTGLSFIWPQCGYVLGSVWSGLSIGSNQNILWHTNPFLLQENEIFFIFSKMILQVSRKLLPFLLLSVASLESFPTQNFFSEQQLVSFMSSELLYEVIALQQSNLEYPKWIKSSQVSIQNRKV